ncbi:unnamed protein product, partial [Hapterophycus canaliculatus]
MSPLRRSACRQMGSNTILMVDEDFRHVEVRHVGDIKETHGFSSFK